jgi:hypothetical protein
MFQRLDGVREANRCLWVALTPFILQKSRMRKRARTDLCGGRSAMIVPTATKRRCQCDCRMLADFTGLILPTYSKAVSAPRGRGADGLLDYFRSADIRSEPIDLR